MSALFMGHHRYSTINPDDIARFGGKRLSISSFAVSDSKGEDEEDADTEFEDEDESTTHGDGGESAFKRHAVRRQSTRSRASTKKYSLPHRLYRKWRRIYRKYGFNHVIPILVLVVYSFAGALVFQAIERPYAEQKKINIFKRLENNRRFASTAIVDSLALPNDEIVNEKLWRILHQFERNNSLPILDPISWDIWGSLFYCGTIYTTVGYGTIYPETTAGWICTVIYAFFGVPLLLAILSDIGQLLCYWMDRGWIALRERLPKRHRKRLQGGSGNKSQGGDQDGASEGDDNIKAGTPVIVALALTFAWLLMCSALFCVWEKRWTYFTAFYFFFISLSTIGLGDIAPDNPMLMVLMSGFLIIGLCLVSMTIGVVQEHIELFLFRVMMALQKECEQLLASGEDVDKKDLVKKVWRKQPWFMRRFMPALMGGEDSKRLNNFADAAITDTAVNMGLIPPPPPGYNRALLLAGTSGRCVPPILGYNTKPHTNQHDGADLAPTETTGTALKPLVPKVATVRPQQRHETDEVVPGEKMITRRSLTFAPTVDDQRVTSSNIRRPRPKMVQTDLTALDLVGKHADTLSTISLASWNDDGQQLIGTKMAPFQLVPTPKSLMDTYVQTDLTGKEIQVKYETLSNLSLASWCEDEEQLLPPSMRPMKTFAADDLAQFRDVAQQLTSTSNFDTSTQTDFFPSMRRSDDELSTSSSSEFVSALETRALILLPRSTQTDRFECANAETQTRISNTRNAEIQTSSIPHSEVSVQHEPSLADDETQTDLLLASMVDQDEVGIGVLENSAGQETEGVMFMENEPMSGRVASGILVQSLADKFTQVDLKVRCLDVEVQTSSARTRNLETQVTPSVLNAETQTVQRRISFQVTANDESGQEGADVDWTHNAWISDRNGKRLHAVIEEEEDYDTDEDDEEDFQDEEFDLGQETVIISEDEEDSSGPVTFSDGCVTLPAITVSPPSSVSSESSVSPDRRRTRRHRKEGGYGCTLVETGIQTDEPECHTVACQTARFRNHAVITAAIATQTEDIFTVARKPGRAEALIGRDRHTGSFRKKLSAWTERKRMKDMHPSVGVQTDGYAGDGVRDIIIQTDESYLRMARRLDTLRTMRARSLRIVVAPQLKQRLNRLAGTSADAASRLATRSRPGKS